MNQDAIAYARRTNDASVYPVPAGDSAPPAESDSATCLGGVLQPLLGDDIRSPGAPHTPRTTTLANVLKYGARYLSPSRWPTNVSIWSAYRSESPAYTRHPACPHDAHLVQLNVNSCAGFGAGAFAAPHTSGGTGKLTSAPRR